ncbi:flagellar filament capping protein FliD [Janthinobacterium sp. 1_2014MBL_MicDiv]|uniref:flagellar filament capping protein FliD n=1 Tax=Janthinobacterium sp. 1_2014MBL_MicDiv TaxID=1644131 RepID=UPI0008F4A78D|nr:flagellar filament capping protein FliD [Janthinobacterium sp. 1_2014MBL_MicDiv]APA67730.1 flagellar hook 2 domain-containing protein [Janthinobacterium sp. 1_2014MBL_MicDiv]
MFNSTINSRAYTNNTQQTTQGNISADVYAKVERQMQSQNTGVVKLNASLARDQAKFSGLGQLQSALAKFQTVAKNMSGSGLATSATPSAKDVLSATTTDKAASGSHELNVKQLAQGQTLLSGAQKSSTTPIGTGAPALVKIELGTVDGKQFTPGGGKIISLTIDSSNNSLDGIAAALKQQGIDASVVKGPDGYSLALNGKSGADSSMRISVAGDAAVSNLLAYAPGSAKGMQQTVAAQDALLTVDGKEVKSATNTLTTAIEGATIELKKKGTTDLVIAKDSSQIASNVASFVTAYNELNSKLQSLQQGDLKSDTALGQVRSQMEQVLRTASTGVPASVLGSAGVTLGKSGELVLDEKKLKAAIAADPDAVSKLFTNNGKGVADQFASKIGELTGETSIIRKEVQTVGKEITTLTNKKAVLAKALTAQAQALVKAYSAQEQMGLNSALPGYTGKNSLFDFMA